MSLKRRIRKLEDRNPADENGGYFAVARLDEDGNLPETVEAFLSGGRDRREMAPDDERIKTLVTYAYAGHVEPTAP